MSETFFNMEMPDLRGLIYQLNMFDERQNKAVRDAMHKIGDNIVQAQKRRIETTEVGKKLAGHITRSKLYLTTHGYLKISAGYQEPAFKRGEDGFNPGVVGMTYEFGRPGTSSTRSQPTMKQKRKRIRSRTNYESWKGRKNWSKAEPTEVEISKGTIQPVPHIRAGYDETLEQNIYLLIDAVNDVIDRLGE